MSDENVTCPICFGDFAKDKIERHAAHCDGSGSGGGGGGGGGGGRGGGGGGRGGGRKPFSGDGEPCPGGCGMSGNAANGGFCNECAKKFGITATHAKKEPKIGPAPEMKGKYVYGAFTIEVRQGDICRETAEAIVNAANDRLDHASGVAGALSWFGGPEIQRESDQIMNALGGQPLPTGDVAVTGPGKLRCKCVIHAVGPVWHGGQTGEIEFLKGAVRRSLMEASQRNLTSIALPAISSGIFNFPKPLCAELMFSETVNFFATNPKSTVRNVRFTNLDNETVDIFLSAIPKSTIVVPHWERGVQVEGQPTMVRKLCLARGSHYRVEGNPCVLDYCNAKHDLVTKYALKNAESSIQDALREAASNGPQAPIYSVQCSMLTSKTFLVVTPPCDFSMLSCHKLKGVIGNAIQHAVENGQTHVALPIFGPGLLGWSPSHGARLTLEAAYACLTSPALGKLESITLCEPDDCSFFADEARKRLVPIDEENARAHEEQINRAERNALAANDPATAPSNTVNNDDDAAAKSLSPTQSMNAKPDQLIVAKLIDGADWNLPETPDAPTTAPPANETPAEKRARQRLEAERRLKVQLAQEQM